MEIPTWAVVSWAVLTTYQLAWLIQLGGKIVAGLDRVGDNTFDSEKARLERGW